LAVPGVVDVLRWEDTPRQRYTTAIHDALRDATGVRFTSLPFTEDRIFAKLNELTLP
jgi:hypothetical protein